MKTTKTEFHFFDITEHEKEQEYLSRMHREGWKVSHIGIFGAFHFESCTPENMVYQLDYYQENKFQREEYLQMFRDCGWEYLFDVMEYHYFRKPVSEMDGKEEIFCDDESRLEMMKRVFRGRMLLILVLFLTIVLPNIILQIVDYSAGNPYKTGSLIFWVIMLLLYVFISIRFAFKYYAYRRRAAR